MALLKAHGDLEKDELMLRQFRNSTISGLLQKGRTVQMKQKGWSLHPRVHKGDCCLFDTFTSASDLRVGDLVVCEVQPGKRCSAYFIIHMEWKLTAASARDDDKAKYYIGNQACKVVGWCYKEQIYGRLIEVMEEDLGPDCV